MMGNNLFYQSGGSGGGDMYKATYDPLNISEQIVGINATQTLQNKTLKQLLLTSPTELTILNGNITVSQGYHSVDGEGDLDDELITINGNLNSNLIVLFPNNSARKITIVNGTGNIRTNDGNNYTIPDNAIIILTFDGANWRMLGGGSGSSASNEKIKLFTATDEQTVFNVGEGMLYDARTSMFINGIKQVYGETFNIDSNPQLIIFNPILYSLKNGYTIEIRYYI